MRHDIIIAGVGGQGILTIARVLSLAAIAKGLNVKQAEVHGMSQRGGAVYSHLRISDQEIFSDLIPAGQVDMILAIEPLEALRYVPMLRPSGIVVASTNAEVNIPDYPAIERVLGHIAEFESHVAIDMEKLARAAGGVLSANIVALGAASRYLGFTLPELQAAVEQLFAAKGDKVVQTNIRALRFGRTAATAYREALERGVNPAQARGWIATLSAEHLAAEDLDFAELETTQTGLTGAEAHAFESLLRNAYDEGRSQLYEHEVYRLIELVGAISPPRHVFVSKGSTIAEDVLASFPGERVVLKLVSPGVVHKTEAGAVAILPKDLDRVRAEIERMIGRHAPHVSVTGVLLVEFVEHNAHGLGSELFVGIRATREFGPVIAAGLGGVHTEYLASKMRPGVAVAKAVATDVDAETFLELFRATAAYDILSGQVRGQDRVVSDGELLRCFRAFISIARQFCVDRGEEGPDIGELEVNPFAFVDQRLIPLDGRGRLKPASKAAPARPAGRLANLLEPERIALVGMSAKSGSFGHVILDNIIESGFNSSNITIVKPGTEEFGGIRCVPTISDLDEVADLLVITVPAAATADIIREANSSGKVRSGIVISGGAGEAEGSEAIGEAIETAIREGRSQPEGGAVFLGPNCMGVRSRPGKYDTFFVPEAKLPARRSIPDQPLALVSQSGAFIVSRLSTNTDLNPRFAISIGNQVDATVSDLVREVGRRDDISVVGVYLEGFADLDGAAMLDVVSELRSLGKSVVFYKAGRTESGRSAAAGHTAAVAGDYDICQTAMAHAGAFVAEDFREFGLALELAVGLAGRSLGQGRVFALTNAGMEAVAMADAGIRLEPLSDAIRDSLDELLTEHGLRGLVSPRNPLDLTPAANEAAYDAAVRVAAASPDVDAILVSCVPLAPSLQTLSDEISDPASFVQRAREWRASTDKAILAVFDGGPEYDALREGVRAAGIPVFRSADDAARLLSRWMGAQ